MTTLAGSRQAAVTATTTPNDNPLVLGADLYYVSGTSNKYHRSILAGRHVIVKYGRRDQYGGRPELKSHETEEKAAAAYWGLVRSKVGKGYHVKDALTFDLPEDTFAGLNEQVSALGNGRGIRASIDNAVYTFERLLTQRVTANVNRSRIELGPGASIRSPRTPKQGKNVLLALTQREPDPDALIAAACASEAEEFLRYIALTHPMCPEEAEVAAALAIGDWSLLY